MRREVLDEECFVDAFLEELFFWELDREFLEEADGEGGGCLRD